MLKSELIQQVAARNKIPINAAAAAVDAILAKFVEALVANKRVEIRGFGSFKTRCYAAYVGRNPKSGTPISVSPKRLPYFRAGKEMLERLNAR